MTFLEFSDFFNGSKNKVSALHITDPESPRDRASSTGETIIISRDYPGLYEGLWWTMSTYRYEDDIWWIAERMQIYINRRRVKWRNIVSLKSILGNEEAGHGRVSIIFLILAKKLAKDSIKGRSEWIWIILRQRNLLHVTNIFLKLWLQLIIQFLLYI